MTSNLRVAIRPGTLTAEFQLKNPDWGIKHICQHCQAKYYDMNREPIVCPKCNTAFDATVGLKSRGEIPFKPYTPRPRHGPTRATPLGLVEAEAPREESAGEAEEEDKVAEDDEEEEASVAELSAHDQDETAADIEEGGDEETRDAS